MCLALTIVVSSVAMLNVALRDIAVDLGSTQTQQLWIVDAYVLVLAALLLPAGALGDRYGRRSALLIGTLIFGVASLLAANATGSSALIAWRAIAGIGAAAIMPGTLSTITSVFPAEERARAVGVWAGFAGGGAILGILGAGAILEHFYWGSIFLVTTGLAALAFIVTLITVPNTQDPAHAHLDPLGSILSLAGIGALVLGVIEGPERGWTSLMTISALVVALASLVLFLLWEARTTRPLLDPCLFAERGFATGTAALAVLFLAMFGFFLILLQFLQLILGYSTLKSAVAILPIAVTMLPLSAIAATLSERYGQRNVGTLGLVLSAVSFLYVATLQASSSYIALLPGMLAIGAGVALAMTPATNAIVSSLPLAKQGVASAVNDTAREVGAALGIAVLGSAFNAGYRHAIDPIANQMPPGPAAAVRDSPAAGYFTAQQIGAAADRLAEAVRDSFITGMRWSMLLAAGLLLLGALYVWMRAPQVLAADQDRPEGLPPASEPH
jgi:EmrB/QacA subfamily drug resistance transporter